MPLLRIANTDIHTEHHPSIPSTQLRAHELLHSDPDAPILVSADRQTGGLGRTGRRWESPLGGLWLTLLWPLPPSPEPILHSLGLRVGLALARTASTLLAPHPGAPRVRLKWPNDILLETDSLARKVAGILVEIKHRPSRAYAVIGVGLNLNVDPHDLPPDLADVATSLRAHTGAEFPITAARDILLAELIDALHAERLDPDRLLQVRALLWGVGRTLTITLADKSRVQGELLGIADDGRLQLLRDGAPWLAPFSAELASPTT